MMVGEDGFDYEWRVHAATQYDSFSKHNISRKRFFEETNWPEKLEGQRILDAGCGSGRFTEIALSTGADVVAIDAAAGAVDSCKRMNKSKNLKVRQLDITALNSSLKLGKFDKIFCFGVLQHTPNSSDAISILMKHLKNGGELVADTYMKYPIWKRPFITKYWVRPITKHMDPKKLYAWCVRHVNRYWKLSRWLCKFRGGHSLSWALLVPNYSGVLPLPDHQLKQWAILDAFDMLHPKYDRPMSIRQIVRMARLLADRYSFVGDLVTQHNVPNHCFSFHGFGYGNQYVMRIKK